MHWALVSIKTGNQVKALAGAAIAVGLAKEKGVEPEIIISAVQDALEAAARKRYKNEALRARFNQETGQLELYAVKRHTRGLSVRA